MSVSRFRNKRESGEISKGIREGWARFHPLDNALPIPNRGLMISLFPRTPLAFLLATRCILLPLFLFLVHFLTSSCLAEEEGKYNREWITDDIQIEGNRFFKEEELLSEIKLKPGSSYSVDLLERGIDKILTLYEENGFPYCQISPSGFRLSEEGRLSFSFVVEEGPRVRIREIQLEGLRDTRRKVILRELGAGLFGFFSQSRVNASLRRLKRLSFIEKVEKVELLAGDNPEEGILRITLRERRNNTFSGILGYAPPAGGKKGSLFGNMSMVFDNMFGTGRRLEWSWSRKDPYSSCFLFLYREPWVFGFPPTLEFELSQTDYDSTYLRISLEARLLFNSTDRLSWGIKAGWEKVAGGSAKGYQLPNSRKYRVGLILVVDFLDQSGNPRKGFLYHAEMDYAAKRNYPPFLSVSAKRRASLLKFAFDLNHFIPTLRKQTLMVGLHYRGLISDEEVVPLSDQFKLGGLNTIRGYREEEFSGTQIGWTNLEYRFLLNQDSRFFLFADWGYFQPKVSSYLPGGMRKAEGSRLGYGFGVRIASRVGLLGIDYGLGEGDGFSQGKIHFGITNRF